MARVLLACLAAAAVGCTISREYVGDGLSEEQLEALVVAETKADVLEDVGPPVDMGLTLEGSIFIYRFRFEEADALSLSLFQASFDYEATDRRTARLVVFFDKEGTKTRYGIDRARGEE